MYGDEALRSADVGFSSIDPDTIEMELARLCDVCGQTVPIFAYDFRDSWQQTGKAGYCCPDCAFKMIGAVFAGTQQATLRAEAEEAAEADES
jgi:hypothetical protein